MRAIHKFSIEPGESTVLMNKGAESLLIAQQGQYLCVWAIVDTEQPLVERQFYGAGTGHALPDHVRIEQYVSTVQIRSFGPPLVFHFFDLGEC